MCVGMFIALLDIQIVASSLQDIGGGLSAAQDQISWVQTAYLIAEIIVIPLSGWLTRVFSTRWLFAASAAGFTIASLLCGLAWNIESMILFRALQGLLGASMIPTVFTSSFYFFQGQRRVYAAAVIGTIASVAPTLGPVIGGWITDTLNWHWLFYVNLLPGIAITILVALLVKIDEPDLKLLKDADYPGIALMAIAPRHARNTCLKRARAGTGSTMRRSGPAPGSRRSPASCSSIRSLTFARPVVDLRALEQPQFRGRLLSVLRHRHRHLLDDLPDAAVPRLCARVQRVADRRRDLLDGRRLARRRAGLHPAGAQNRHALADDVRPRAVRAVDVELQLHHP